MAYRPVFPLDATLEGAWKSIDSLVVKKLPDNKFHVDVEYHDDGRKQRKYSFEGTSDVIQHSIDAAKDLKQSERLQLFRILELYGVGAKHLPPVLHPVPGLPPAPPGRPSQPTDAKVKNI